MAETTQTQTESILGAAERKTANILAYSITIAGIAMVLNGAFLAGALLLGGSFVLMPRFPYLGGVHPLVGWALVILAFATLS